jgi:uncharacterized protein YdiU (UPF0061 family)
MTANAADFTLTFRGLSDAAAEPTMHQRVRRLFADPSAYDAWAQRWRKRLEAEPHDPATRAAAMHAANPRFIPRNHRVEAAISSAVMRDDFRPFEELVTVLSRPYEDQPEFAHYADPPEPHERVLRTFCGT